MTGLVSYLDLHNHLQYYRDRPPSKTDRTKAEAVFPERIQEWPKNNQLPLMSLAWPG